jgi:hypothetical protein
MDFFGSVKGAINNRKGACGRYLHTHDISEVGSTSLDQGNQDDGIIAVPHLGHLVERHRVPLTWGALYPHFGQRH